MCIIVGVLAGLLTIVLAVVSGLVVVGSIVARDPFEPEFRSTTRHYCPVCGLIEACQPDRCPYRAR